MLSFSTHDSAWTVQIEDTSVSLATTTYDTRNDFRQRIEQVLDAVATVGAPPVVDRLGIRYVNRVIEVDDLSSLVIPELRGLHASFGTSSTMRHSLTESLLDLPDDRQLLVRSGLLPGGGTFDSSVLPAIAQPVWFLDLDAFVTTELTFAADTLAELAHQLASTAYSFFRFAVYDELLVRSGGTPRGGE